MIFKRPLVIDLSAWEMDVFWDRQASDPPLLMITRLTLGKSYTDFMATSHVNGARSIGSKVGVYHFLEFNDIQGQIDTFLNACRERGYLVGNTWTLDVPPVLDVEKVPNGGPEGSSWAYQIKVWLDAVETATGQRPWIYTSRYYWEFTFDRDGNPPAWTNDYPLWVAQYFDNPDLHEVPSPLPAGWTDWIAWQYSAAGILPMCPYDGIDMNKASDKLLADLGSVIPPPPPPQGEPMNKYHIVGANAGSTFTNIRADHSASSEDIGDLPNGQFADGDTLWESADKTQMWLNILSKNGVAVTRTSWVAVKYNNQVLCTLTENTVEPPPATAHHLEVVVDGVVEYSKDF